MRITATGMAAVLAAVAVFGVAAAMVAYGLYPGYLEHGEAAIAATAFRLLHGMPAYYAFDAPERITNIYGPWTYLWHAVPLALFGATLTTSKIAALTGPVLVITGAWAVGRRFGRFGEAVAVALAAGFIIMHLGFPVTVRPDALLTALVALATWAAARTEGPGWAWAESLAIGIAGGVAANIKIHAGLYFAPVALLHLAGDWRRLLPMAAAGSVALAAPFLSPLFPLGDYLSWFGPISAKENTWNGFRVLWMKFALYLGVPVAAWALAGRQALAGRERTYLAAYVACVLVALFPATKNGASHHYYMPFLPLLVDLSLRAFRAGRRRVVLARALVGFAALVLLLAAQTERRFFKSLEWTQARDVTAEIEALIRANPGLPMQMGVGDIPQRFYLYSWRDLPVFAGGPYTMDAGIVMEMTKLGVPMPAEATRRMAACETRLWLIPGGESPFTLKGYYDQTIFDAAFRDAFMAHHHKVASGRYFDLWRCEE